MDGEKKNNFNKAQSYIEINGVMNFNRHDEFKRFQNPMKGSCSLYILKLYDINKCKFY
jgi:hypothetical protein